MKNIFTVFVIAIVSLFFVSCNSRTSKVNVSAKDITYIKDRRTGICYAFVGQARGAEITSSAFDFTVVPCDSLENL